MTTTDIRDVTAPDWWRHAVIYQVYLRSFADGNGDGVGDIAGLRSRLPYLAVLGVDAVWINPWYRSPMADAGYDVADPRDIDPVFGTLAEADAMIAEAHALGLRVLLDIVPNHSSDRRPWFQAALAAGPGSPERERYWFRPGRGANGELPPNNWRSEFGGPAWTRVTDPDGTPGEWYLHLFAPQQPDLNWNHPEVRADFEATLRFWFDRGVDGFRIDVAPGMIKHDNLPDVLAAGHGPGEHPHWDRDAVHQIYRGWRKIADSYFTPRVFVAEAWVDTPDRLALYLRPDELHTAFNFHYLVTPWRAEELRATITETVDAHASVGAPPSWVLSNHDVARHVSRYARHQSGKPLRLLDDVVELPADLATGTRRARAAVLLMLALPGCAYVYLGEELGLPEVEDLPDDAFQDPTWERSGRTSRGRDGCRVPIPWAGAEPPYGFNKIGNGRTWLPQPGNWAPYTAEAQKGDPTSTLELYRNALRVRRATAALGDGDMRWEDAPDGVLSFSREPGFQCLVNISDGPIAIPAGTETLLASDGITGGALPVDTAVWLRTTR
ncbi:glycoside hydrolase family 13 protein [Nocardia terpenica]|uniref:Alpha-glucosidase n=1 Tax=Nocardia terpenica TaxID=455432 RepID=A0A291RP62_9NOCA|nr:glycoside hydrolase family 13 protein [Nocardia terpenica]ATL69343.1 alpha-glucosidase [Nocardia terpenica]